MPDSYSILASEKEIWKHIQRYRGEFLNSKKKYMQTNINDLNNVTMKNDRPKKQNNKRKVDVEQLGRGIKCLKKQLPIPSNTKLL